MIENKGPQGLEKAVRGLFFGSEAVVQILKRHTVKTDSSSHK